MDKKFRDVNFPYFYKIDPVYQRVDGPSGWGFSAKLSIEFAHKAKNMEIPENVYENIQKEGLELIKYHFKNTPLENLVEKNWNSYRFVEDSLLLKGVCVPGDACDLSLGNCLNKVFDNEFEGIFNLDYVPHNVDVREQANALSSLWIHWTDIADAFIRTK